MYYSSLSCTVCQHVSISHHAYDEGVRFTAGMTKLISYLPQKLEYSLDEVVPYLELSMEAQRAWPGLLTSPSAITPKREIHAISL
jgi:hypothetical protein